MTVEKRFDNRIAMLGFGGAITIYEAKKMLGLLKESFEAGDELKIDLTEVSSIDTSGIQLIWSVHKTAKKMGKKYSVTGASEAVLKTIRRAGLDPSELLSEVRLQEKD